MDTKPIDQKRLAVFFDFDNTITRYDVLDDMLIRFSADDGWKALEKMWRDGKIGSRACLDGQIRGIDITKRELDAYLKTIEIDPYFKKILEFLKSRNIKTFIVSDNFDYILKSILCNNDIDGIETYSNRLKFREGRLLPRFLSPKGKCDDGECGHCKKDTLLKNIGKGRASAYVGDGRSDICPARSADIVFAKDDLLDHFRKNGLEHIPFKDLGDVYNYFKENIK